ncbi:hypothetical protein CG740_35100 [Streptomyces sp. CB01201]|uniref:hypothetical protein n=1 Tax=Streptomyces sp. CB01201 TaxID=2020324 RepID=UPI000C27CF16|nr:hypothetical protein [Streptomyces sp. CB01201]PJM98488.1 hypothetical protein CG740_35100 [Streptomyces sp. CB01201]
MRHARFGRDQAELTARTYADHIVLYLRWCVRSGRVWRTAAATGTTTSPPRGLSRGHYGTGGDTAACYLAQQPGASPELPVLTALHGLNAVCIRTSPDAAKGFLLTQPHWIVQGVTRYQFCAAAYCAGYSREHAEALLDQLCADETGQRLK